MERNEIVLDGIEAFFKISYGVFTKYPTDDNYIFVIKLVDELRIHLPDDEIIKKKFEMEMGDFCRDAINLLDEDFGNPNLSEEKDLLETAGRDFINLLEQAIRLVKALDVFHFLGTSFIRDEKKDEFIKNLHKIMMENNIASQQ